MLLTLSPFNGNKHVNTSTKSMHKYCSSSQSHCIMYGLQHGTRNLISLQVQCKTCRDKYGSRILKRGDLDKDWNGIGCPNHEDSSQFGPGHPASP